jgi:hypothetical protein
MERLKQCDNPPKTKRKFLTKVFWKFCPKRRTCVRPQGPEGGPVRQDGPPEKQKSVRSTSDRKNRGFRSLSSSYLSYMYWSEKLHFDITSFLYSVKITRSIGLRKSKRILTAGFFFHRYSKNSLLLPSPVLARHDIKFFFGYWLNWLLGSWVWLSKHLIIRQRSGLDYQALW